MLHWARSVDGFYTSIHAVKSFLENEKSGQKKETNIVICPLTGLSVKTLLI